MTETKNNWGRWGKDDERGAVNMLSPETNLAALRLPTTGKLYQLGMPIARSGIPSFGYRPTPQRLTMMNENDEWVFEPYGGTPGVGANEDVVMWASHTSTHVDALCHVYGEGTTYNGFPNAMEPYGGAKHSGIEKTGPVLSRGVLIDVAKSKGVDWLEPSYPITVDDLREAMSQQAVTIKAGDVVTVRTGWVDEFYAAGAEHTSLAQAGLSLEASRFLASFDIVAVGADNSGVEVQPFDEGKWLGSHLILLKDHGILMIEHLDLRELSADGCHEFLFCMAPLRVTGATGSAVNPFAIG
jgi:kynurenine formamidase